MRQLSNWRFRWYRGCCWSSFGLRRGFYQLRRFAVCIYFVCNDFVSHCSDRRIFWDIGLLCCVAGDETRVVAGIELGERGCALLGISAADHDVAVR